MEIYGRRHDTGTAHCIQYAIALLYIAGAAEARRYLVRHGVADDIIGRILSGESRSRREIDAPGGNRA